MASLIYNSALDDMASGAIDFANDTFKVMLVTSSYTPNKDTHDKRSDVGYEITGTGYTAGGETAETVVTMDDNNDKLTIQFVSSIWQNATITARGAVFYKSRGGAASADELVAYNDFGTDVSCTNGTFTIATSTITLQN